MSDLLFILRHPILYIRIFVRMFRLQLHGWSADDAERIVTQRIMTEWQSRNE